MDYISLQIPVSDAEQGEILTAELADYPFESFETEGGVLKAYIPQERLADCKTEVDSLLDRYGVRGRYIAIETQVHNNRVEAMLNWGNSGQRTYSGKLSAAAHFPRPLLPDSLQTRGYNHPG